MGSDYTDIVNQELTEEALYWLNAPNEQLVHAPRRPSKQVRPAQDELTAGELCPRDLPRAPLESPSHCRVAGAQVAEATEEVSAEAGAELSAELRPAEG